MDNWNDVFKMVVALIAMALGAPITQLLKRLLSKIFKREVQDRWALILTAVVSAGVAALEMQISGVIDFSVLTLGSFPAVFGSVFTLSTVYYHLFKDSSGVMGQRLLLKE